MAFRLVPRLAGDSPDLTDSSIASPWTESLSPLGASRPGDGWAISALALQPAASTSGIEHTAPAIQTGTPDWMTSINGYLGRPGAATAAGMQTDGSHSGQSARLDQFSSGGHYFFSGDQDVDAVLIGSRWTPTNITYSFPSSGSVYGKAANYYDPDFVNNQDPFNAAQQTAAKYAFGLIASYTNLTFTETTNTDAAGAMIRLSQASDNTDLPSAMGNFPGSDPGDGDVWFGESGQPYYTTPAVGNWGQATMMHEIGHTMGLKHGQDNYTSTDLVAPGYIDGPGPRYGSQAITADHDGQAWSLMTYRSDPDNKIQFEGDGSNQPQTYMQLDIAALQYVYGANFSSNGGDSVYTFSQSTGEMSINGVGRGAPTSPVVFRTIWDGSGVDTYDFSNYSGREIIDLAPGAFSTFNSAQLANVRAYSHEVAFAPGNIANALLYQGDTRSLIENAIGGAGGDQISGNVAGNVLNGAGGGDHLYGLDGADTLIGGGGDDTVDGGADNDVLVGGLGADHIFGGAGIDTLTYAASTSGIDLTIASASGGRLGDAKGDIVDTTVESIVGTGFGDRIAISASAAAVAFTLDGGSGADNLEGGAGNDLLIGGEGDDVMAGGLGINVFSGGSGSDTITYAQASGAVRIDLGSGVVTGARHDSFGGVETFVGSNFNDTFIGGANADRIVGGLGVDLIDYSAASAGVRVDLTTGVGSGGGLSAGDAYLSIEDVYGSLSGGNSLRGSSADNRLYGGGGADTLAGEAGADSLSGAGGDDQLSGGDGADILLGLLGNDTLAGDAGDDALDGDEGADSLDGGADNDRLLGGSGADTLAGGSGDDTLKGGAGADINIGGNGRDTVDYSNQDGSSAAGVDVDLGAGTASGGDAEGDTFSGIESVIGTDQNDRIFLGAQSGSIDGFGGRDQLVGGNGDDTIRGHSYDDQVYGGAGNDQIFGSGFMDGGSGDDTLHAGAFGGFLGGSFSGGDGADKLFGSTSADYLSGGAGADSIVASDGDDTISGASGNDTIFAGAGDDSIGAGLGNDLIDGGAGRDWISGSAGQDTLTGGAGTDRFVFTVYDLGVASHDLITDVTGMDKVDLSQIDANSHKAGDQRFALVAAFDGHAAEATLVYNKKAGVTVLSMDTDGDGKADAAVWMTGDHHDFTGFVL